MSGLLSILMHPCLNNLAISHLAILNLATHLQEVILQGDISLLKFYLHKVRQPHLFRLLVLEDGIYLDLQKLQTLLGVFADAVLISHLYGDLQVFAHAALMDSEN